MSGADVEGVVLGEKYRIMGPLGRGGMGAVFEAEHTLTGRRLAVKVLLPQFAQNEVLAKRFINEARAAAAIRDPHVVEVVDLGRTPEGELYLVLEYLDGRDLKAAIRAEAPFPLERAVHIMSQIAGLMGHAHALNIVHRDLKPANVFLLTRDGDVDYVKVLDFGIAKLRPQHEDGEDHTQLTRTHDVVGTPLYMAPEQLKGSRSVDARADVYSLGVMLYQMLAGQLPYVGDSMADIYLKVMTEAPPVLASVRPDVDPELAAVVERAIHRDPAQRFATGADLAAALAPWAARWSTATPRTAAGFTPGAKGPVGGTTPGVQRNAAPASLAGASTSPLPPDANARSTLPLAAAAVVACVVVFAAVYAGVRANATAPSAPAVLAAQPAAAQPAQRAVLPETPAVVVAAVDAAAVDDASVDARTTEPTRPRPRVRSGERPAARPPVPEAPHFETQQ